MTGPSRRSALRIGGATLASVSLAGCLGGRLARVGRLLDESIPEVEWTRSFEYSHRDDGCALVQTADGGFAFVADDSTFGTEETTESNDVRVVRTTPDGAERWTRVYGDFGSEFADDLVPATDGEGFVVGGSRSSGVSSDAWLFRIDADGRTEWSRTYDVDERANFASVVAARDGGYLLAGNGIDGGWVVKTSASGAQEWTRKYRANDLPEHGSSGLSQVVRADDGYFLAGHATTSSETGFSWFRKVDAAGNVEWRARYREDGRTARATDAALAADGGVLVVGSTAGMGLLSDPDWALKFDADGRRAWTKTYSKSLDASVVALPDGGSVVASRAGSLALRRIDAGGETEWRTKYPSVEVYLPDALVRTEDGGYAVLGRRHAGSIGDYGLTDAVLVKLR